jgi:hypothetical protein
MAGDTDPPQACAARSGLLPAPQTIAGFDL